ncbi:unnamed protein product, partial [marine sediment metagenome]
DGPTLLSGIIANVTGNSTEEFAKKYLFDPLGILKDEYYWTNDSKGIDWGGYGFACSPKVQAKIGMLCLNNGTWNGTQIVDKNYIRDATTTQISGSKSNYGYLFYTDGPFEGYFAAGAAGQYIYVIPKYNIVVGFTASLIIWVDYEDLISDYILQFVEIEPDPDPDPEDPVIPGFNLNMIILTIFSTTTVLLIRRKKQTRKLK